MYLTKHLIGVVMHQMVTRGYNVFDMQLFNLFISDENGNIIDRIESASYCIAYSGLPCCPQCVGIGYGCCIDHCPRCFFDGVCKNCENGCGQ